MINDKNEEILILFFLPEKAVKNKVPEHRLFGYIFHDYKKDGFYVLLVTDHNIKEKLLEKISNNDLVLVKEKNEINDEKMLKIIEYIDSEKI